MNHNNKMIHQLTIFLLLTTNLTLTSSFLTPQTLTSNHHATTPTKQTTLAATLHRDILIIGSGLAGLSIAHHLSLSSRRHITILERETSPKNTVQASHAAAGMLAPQSERMVAGPLLDLCLASREMYAGWVEGLECGAREGASFSSSSTSTSTNDNNNDVHNGVNDGVVSDDDDWSVGFHSTGGFLAPAFAGDAVATWSPQPSSGLAHWLDSTQIHELEPLLHPNVVGGWWFPEDASVDARRLLRSLRASCLGRGVHILTGSQYEVTSLEMKGGKCTTVHLACGKILTANDVIVANGSWMKQLLPVPIVPHKGQSLSLKMDPSKPPILNRVLFAQDTYIVPKADGRIIVGATVEPNVYDGDITPEGMVHILSEAMRLIPALKELPIEETWAGLRPTTPDKGPILGGTMFDNVYVAGGYWRNGVLLAPKTGQLVGDLVLAGGDLSKLSSADRELLNSFNWDRFTKKGSGKSIAANARYASSLYPVHKRSFGSSSVGVELGFYEGAAAAGGDRMRDREMMFGGDEGVLERAAEMGRSDAGAFDFGDDDEEEEEVMEITDADPDALTVGVLEEQSPSTQKNSTSQITDLSSIYDTIKANKAKASESLEMSPDTLEEKPDFPFRIYHVDKKTRQVSMVPPYTSPGEFFQMKKDGKIPPATNDEILNASSENDIDSSMSKDVESSTTPIPQVESTTTAPIQQNTESTYDGYTAIREAFGECNSEEETARAMQNARRRNRIKSGEIDESIIGAMSFDGEG